MTARDENEERRVFMAIRDELATKAPITPEMVALTIGYSSLAEFPLVQDADRRMFMTIWAMLNYEWADAMIEDAGRQ